MSICGCVAILELQTFVDVLQYWSYVHAWLCCSTGITGPVVRTGSLLQILNPLALQSLNHFFYTNMQQISLAL